MRKQRKFKSGLPPVAEQVLDQLLEDVRTSQELADSPEFIKRFPYLLRKAREDAGLKVRALGRRAGIDPGYVSKLEHGLAPPPTWPVMANIAVALPGSELAQIVELLGAGRLRHSVLQMTADLQKLIVSLPATTFSDEAWLATAETQLRKCLMLLRASRDASRGN